MYVHIVDIYIIISQFVGIDDQLSTNDSSINNTTTIMNNYIGFYLILFTILLPTYDINYELYAN